METLFALDLNAPTALGIPLGLLLLIWLLYNAIQQQGEGGGGGVSANTMDVHIRGEVSSDVVLFQHSEQQNSGATA